ncbi:RNA polymerase sigma factor [Haloferula sargassicola]|uniref:RNA polymerase subunit sigma-24 n=1 Tax=Haloferula sargassicola TaxID=490096 RepID=A0ABP9USG6_9BACT
MTASQFHPTQWTLVLRARGSDEPGRAALSELCAAYYEPVVAFLRRGGKGEDEAREMAHAFFESLLAGGIGAPEPGRGRFRSYLLGALKHFQVSRHRAEVAEKRGGGAEHVSLTAAGLPGRADDGRAFDRDWALALIGRALASLEAEEADRAGRFAALRPWLDGAAEGSQAELADRLGMSGTAVKVAIHRLRQRFREKVRREVAATVSGPEEVDEELRHLVGILSMG